MEPELDVCIATHNPRRDIFRKVLISLAQQTLDSSRFRVFVIDNASTLPIEESELDCLRAKGVTAHLLHEPKLGVVHARRRGLSAVSAETLIFVDDDNELSPDYLETAKHSVVSYPEVGCFGGKLLLPNCLQPPRWCLPLLDSLGIRDCGDNLRIDWMTPEWQPWFPAATAGMVLKLEVARHFLRVSEDNQFLASLGRRGKGLMSHEDYFIAHCTVACGLKVCYQPGLRLTHHIAPHRFSPGYMIRLHFAYGRSWVQLQAALGRPRPPAGLLQVIGAWTASRGEAFPSRLCRVAQQLGKSWELIRFPGNRGVSPLTAEPRPKSQGIDGRKRRQ